MGTEVLYGLGDWETSNADHGNERAQRAKGYWTVLGAGNAKSSVEEDSMALLWTNQDKYRDEWARPRRSWTG